MKKFDGELPYNKKAIRKNIDAEREAQAHERWGNLGKRAAKKIRRNGSKKRANRRRRQRGRNGRNKRANRKRQQGGGNGWNRTKPNEGLFGLDEIMDILDE